MYPRRAGVPFTPRKKELHSTVLQRRVDRDKKEEAHNNHNSVGRKFTFDQYRPYTLDCLQILSKSASDGIIDVSTDSEKSHCFDAGWLNRQRQHGSPTKIKSHITESFDTALEEVWDKIDVNEKSNEDPRNIFKTEDEVFHFIKAIARRINTSIVSDPDMLRPYKDDRYIPAGDVPVAFRNFCRELFNKIKMMPIDAKGKVIWAQKTTAWIDCCVNIRDYYFVDGSGRIALLLSTFIHMLADTKPVLFRRREHYYNKSLLSSLRKHPTPQMMQEWEKYYVSHFWEQDNYNRDHHILYVLDFVLNTSRSLQPESKDEGGTGSKDHVDKSAIISSVRRAVEDLYVLRDEFPFLVDVNGENDAKREDLEKRKLEEIKSRAIVLKNIILDTAVLINSGRIIYTRETVLRKQRVERFLDYSHRLEYPCLASDKVEAALDAFSRELYLRIEHYEIYDPKETIAFIIYHIIFTKHFFIDGNVRVAIAISAYFSMITGAKLPDVKKKKDLFNEAYVPIKHEADEGFVEKFETSEPHFQTFCNYFRDVYFPENVRVQVILDDIPTDAWKVDIKNVHSWYLPGFERPFLATIYQHDKELHDRQYVARDPIEMLELQRITGEPVKDIVVFRPKRMVLHEAIAGLSTRVCVTSSEDLIAGVEAITRHKDKDTTIKYKSITFTEDVKNVINSCLDEIESFEQQFDDVRRDLRVYVEYVMTTYFSENIRKKPQVSKIVQKAQKLQEVQEDEDAVLSVVKSYQKLISERVANNSSYTVNAKGLLEKLVVDKLCRNHFKRKIREIINKIITKLIEAKCFAELPVHQNAGRVVWAIVGGPASGKSTVSTGVVQQFEGVKLCHINADTFKEVLAHFSFDKAESEDCVAIRAARTHDESGCVVDAILSRLDIEIRYRGAAPHVLIDMVKATREKITLLGHGNATLNLFVTSCLAEEAVQRAYHRAGKRRLENKEPNPDYKRYVPTEAVLEGHRVNSSLLPSALKTSSIFLRLFDTSDKVRGEGLVEIANITAISPTLRELKVYRSEGFFAFLKKSVLNINAQNEGALYLNDSEREEVEDRREGVEDKVGSDQKKISWPLTPKRLVTALKSYIDASESGKDEPEILISFHSFKSAATLAGSAKSYIAHDAISLIISRTRGVEVYNLDEVISMFKTVERAREVLFRFAQFYKITIRDSQTKRVVLMVDLMQRSRYRTSEDLREPHLSDFIDYFCNDIVDNYGRTYPDLRGLTLQRGRSESVSTQGDHGSSPVFSSVKGKFSKHGSPTDLSLPASVEMKEISTSGQEATNVLLSSSVRSVFSGTQSVSFFSSTSVVSNAPSTIAAGDSSRDPSVLQQENPTLTTTSRGRKREREDTATQAERPSELSSLMVDVEPEDGEKYLLSDTDKNPSI